MSEVWHAPAFPSFEIERFGDEGVLYDARDGRTHYLSPIGLGVFQALGERSLATGELMDCLQSTFGIVLSDDEQRRICNMLQQLVALDLLTCDHPL